MSMIFSATMSNVHIKKIPFKNLDFNQTVICFVFFRQDSWCVVHLVWTRQKSLPRSEVVCRDGSLRVAGHAKPRSKRRVRRIRSAFHHQGRWHGWGEVFRWRESLKGEFQKELKTYLHSYTQSVQLFTFRVGTCVIYASWIKCSRLENESFDLVQHAIQVSLWQTKRMLRVWEFMRIECAQVSLMTRIVPSPDWFIGVDGFDLCNDGKWIDTVTLEASQIITFVDHYAPMFQLCTRERADQPQCIILASMPIWKYNHSSGMCVQIGFKNRSFSRFMQSGHKRQTFSINKFLAWQISF